MLTKTEALSYSRAAKGQGRITAAMKACASWAALEEHDKVLDMNCGSGALLKHIDAKQRLTLCGICDSVEGARIVSESLNGADVIAARMEDIPWRDDTFHVVLLSTAMRGDSRRVLDEALRVLKAGGQFVMASPLFLPRGEHEWSRRELMRMMQEAGFQDVSFRASGLYGAIIGWKTGRRTA